MTTWRRLLNEVYERILAWLQTSPPGTLGVLGLALLVVGYYNVRGRPNNSGDQSRRSSVRGSDASATQTAGQRELAAAHPAGVAGTSGHLPISAASSGYAPQDSKAFLAASASGQHCDGDFTPTSALARSINDQLGGVKRITVSALGVLLHEWQAHELQDAATVRLEAVAIMREAARCADVYLVTHVVDDIGQAAVCAALESAGLLGPGRGQIQPHKLLFCSTLEGKVSIVRQLEPELHIDGHAATVDELQRFMPQLVHVFKQGTLPAGVGLPNVGQSLSLAAFFGL